MFQSFKRMLLNFLNLKTFLILFNLQGLDFECTFLNEVIFCQNIGITDIYKECFKDKWQKSVTLISEINISDSNIPKIEYFYKLPQMGNITSITFKNCQLSNVSDNAFYDFQHLTILDLSFNQLEVIFFIDNMSITLEKLILSNNKIFYLDANFSKLNNLKILDLSYNKISVVYFQKIHTLEEINFSHNEIHSIVPSQQQYLGELNFVRLNLSHNKLSEYNEQQFFLIIDWLDLSYNHLETVNLKYSKNYVSFANCKIDSFWEKISAKLTDLTAVEGIEKIKLISDHLVLKNNNFGDLNKFKIDIRDFYDYSVQYLDLSNSYINYIPVEYFKGIRNCSLLNLSFNNINSLKKYTFINSSIDILDLSYSNIKYLDKFCFKENQFKILKLNNNKISTIKDVFYDSKIIKFDLSHNLINNLNFHSFEKLYNVKVLNLSHCVIEKIDPYTFQFLDSLELLDLSENKITVLENNVFNNIPLIYLILKGNKIKSIKSYSFQNLYNISELDLSNLYTENIENQAFYNLPKLKNFDLSHNKIGILLDKIFVECPNLRKIDFSFNPITELNKFSNKLNIIELIISINGTFTPNQISNFNVKYLTIKNSSIDVLEKDSFRGLYSLTHLYFNHSEIKSIDSNALVDLFNLEYLDAQNLFKNVKTLKKGFFQDLNDIETLDISNTGLDSMHSECFIGLIKTKILELNQNNIVEIVNNTFDGLESLELLNLSCNKIAQLKPYSFYGLNKLKILVLAENNLKIISKDSFMNLDQLGVLELQNNQLTVLENNCFRGIPNLMELILSENNLEMLETGVFTSIPELKFLNLHNNNLGLNGSPQHSFKLGVLSNLKNLEILDLTSNHFSIIPVKSVFISLKNLRALYLDYNHLKKFDFEGLLRHSKELEFVGISFNSWHCDYLSRAIELFYNKSVNFIPDVPVFDRDNIEGINCTDVCKYVYCEGQDIEIVQLQ